MQGVPSIPLAGAAQKGVSLPAIGFGVAFGNWTDDDVGFYGFTQEDANRAVTLALENGVRCFDGARFYGTDPILGRILGEHFARGDLTRKDVWVTAKVGHPRADASCKFNPYRALDWVGLWKKGPEELAEGVRFQVWDTLDQLGLGWVDMCMIHWPSPFEGDNGHPLTEDEARRARATIYKTLLEIKATGAMRAIGVGNFSAKHLSMLSEDLPDAEMPAVNQIEIHPYYYNRELIAACQERGIVVQAYSPFASGAFGLLKDPVLVEIAGKAGCTVGQVICRWLFDKGIASVPKSGSASRIKANLDITSFELTAEQSAAIDALSEGKEPRRTCPNPESFN